MTAYGVMLIAMPVRVLVITMFVRVTMLAMILAMMPAPLAGGLMC